MASKSNYFKQNKAKISRKKLRIDTSGKETGASKGRRFVLWGGITALVALFVVVGTAGLGSAIAPPNQVVLSSESHAIDVFSSNGSKLPFALVSNTAEYTTTSNTTYILTNVTAGEMARNNVGKLSVNLTSKAVSPSVVSTSADSGAKPDVTTGATYSVTFSEHNLTNLVSPKYWAVVVQHSNEPPTYHLPAYVSPKEVNTSVSTTLANGSYYFLALTNYTTFVDPFLVNFTVAGKALNLSISFEYLYSLSMNVSGLSGVGNSSFIFTAALQRIDLPSNYSIYPSAQHIKYSDSRSSGAPFTDNVSLTNGTYHGQFTVGVSYAALPQIFTINGAAKSLNVSFSKGYDATFNISNLPSALHSTWCLNVSINGVTENYPVCCVNSTVVTLSNGTYGINGYAINTTTSVQYLTIFKDVTIAGKNVTTNLTFENAYYLTVKETGLLSGTSWSILLSTGQSLKSSTTSLSALLAKDTYNYTATASGYKTLSGNFSLTANKTLNLTFTQLVVIPPLIKATITIGFGTSVSNFVPVVSNVTNISYAMILIQPYFLTGNQSNHLMIEINTSAGSGLKYVTFELLGNNGTLSSFGPIYAEDFGYVAGGTIILVLTFATLPWIAIYREQWIMSVSEKKVS